MSTYGIHFLFLYFSLQQAISRNKAACDDRDDDTMNHQYRHNENNPDFEEESNYFNTQFMNIPFSLVPDKCQSISLGLTIPPLSHKYECRKKWGTDEWELYEQQYYDTKCENEYDDEQIIYDYNISNYYHDSNEYGGFKCNGQKNFGKIIFTWHTNNCSEDDIEFGYKSDKSNTDYALLYVAVDNCAAFDTSMSTYSKMYCVKQNYQSDAKGAKQETDPIRYYGELQFYSSNSTLMDSDDDICDKNDFYSQFIIDDTCSMIDIDGMQLDAQLVGCSFKVDCTEIIISFDGEDNANNMSSFYVLLIMLIWSIFG